MSFVSDSLAKPSLLGHHLHKLQIVIINAYKNVYLLMFMIHGIWLFNVLKFTLVLILVHYRYIRNDTNYLCIIKAEHIVVDMIATLLTIPAS